MYILLYMVMPMNLTPTEIIKEYQIHLIAHHNQIYIKIVKVMYGLPQAGILTNNQLYKVLMPHGYFPCKLTPGLWSHKLIPILFSLIVDNFGIMYFQHP